ncbi:MAG TPA: hypothetical protein VI197_25410, partial [Polyangiaceae bacterium]
SGTGTHTFTFTGGPIQGQALINGHSLTHSPNARMVALRHRSGARGYRAGGTPCPHEKLRSPG